MIKWKYKLIVWLKRNRDLNFIEREHLEYWANELYSDRDYYLFIDDTPRRGFDFYQKCKLYIPGHGYFKPTLKHYYELKEKYDYFLVTGKRIV